MAPISTKVIALLSTMLEHLQQHPDDSAETEALIKSVLHAISSNRRSSIRRMGDAFLDFADERPWLAACVISLVIAVPQQVVTEIWREIYPAKVRIEMKDPETGVYVPADNQTLHAIFRVPKNIGVIYEQGQGIGYEPNAPDIVSEQHGGKIEATTKSGLKVAWIASDDRRPGESARSELRWSGGHFRSGISEFGDVFGSVPIRGGGVPSMQKWWRSASHRF